MAQSDTSRRRQIFLPSDIDFLGPVHQQHQQPHVIKNKRQNPVAGSAANYNQSQSDSTNQNHPQT